MAHTTWVRLLWEPGRDPQGLHPDDWILATDQPPHNDLLTQVGRDEDYLCLRYRGGIIRVKPEAVQHVKAPAFDYGEAVATLPPRTPATGTIHRIEWQAAVGKPRYYISIDNQPRPGTGYRPDELRRIETRRREAPSAQRFPFHVLLVALGTLLAGALYAITPGSSGWQGALRIGHPALAVAAYTGCLRGIATHIWGRKAVVSVITWLLGVLFVILLAAELTTRLSSGGLWAGLVAVGIYELCYWGTEALLLRAALYRADHA